MSYSWLRSDCARAWCTLKLHRPQSS